VRNYRSILIWGRNAEKAAGVARDLEVRGWPISVAADLQTAARSADVISCATPAREPLIKGSWLKTRCHLDLVGGFTPDMRETDDACARGAFIVIDTPGALETSGDLIEPIAGGVTGRDDIVLLGDLVAHTLAHAPNVPCPERTVFKSVGVAHADLAAAQAVYERCTRDRVQSTV